MKAEGCLLAWVERRDTDCFVGAYVGEAAGPDPYRGYPGRAPAIRAYHSPEAARDWVQQEADVLQLGVRWVDKNPWRRSDNR